MAHYCIKRHVDCQHWCEGRWNIALRWLEMISNGVTMSSLFVIGLDPTDRSNIVAGSPFSSACDNSLFKAPRPIRFLFVYVSFTYKRGIDPIKRAELH